MAREGIVLVNNEAAGTITYLQGEYIFKYNDAYFNNTKKRAISVSLPKTKQVYTSKILFPFFFNMLSEGVNKKLQCRQLQIDESDYFGLLLSTGSAETIGAVCIQAKEEE